MLKINESDKKVIEGLIAKERSVASVKGAVFAFNDAKDDATDKEVRAYLLTLNYVSVRATNFISGYYARLKEKDLSKQEFTTLIDNASDNIGKQFKNYNNIRLLCNEIRANAYAKAKELYAPVEVEGTGVSKALNANAKEVKQVPKTSRPNAGKQRGVK